MRVKVNASIQDLYPELHQDGGLAAAVENELIRARKQLRLDDGGRVTNSAKYWIVIEQESKASNVTLDSSRRMFMVGLWDQGVQVGSIESQDLGVAASVIVSFLSGVQSAGDICKEFAGADMYWDEYSANPGALRGRDWQWEGIIEHLSTECPELAALGKDLRQKSPFSEFYPYQSIGGLYFSRWSKHPYSRDLPGVLWIGPGRFKVISSDGKLLGEGGHQTAMALLHAAVGQGVPPGS